MFEKERPAGKLFGKRDSKDTPHTPEAGESTELTKEILERCQEIAERGDEKMGGLLREREAFIEFQGVDRHKNDPRDREKVDRAIAAWYAQLK